MAGFGAKGIQGNTIINIKNLFENRGISYGAGGDEGAVTVPNFLKKYSPKLKGASVGSHLVEVCYGPICPPLQCKINHCNVKAFDINIVVSNNRQTTQR